MDPQLDTNWHVARWEKEERTVWKKLQQQIRLNTTVLLFICQQTESHFLGGKIPLLPKTKHQSLKCEVWWGQRLSVSCRELTYPVSHLKKRNIIFKRWDMLVPRKVTPYITLGNTNNMLVIVVEKQKLGIDLGHTIKQLELPLTL